MKSTFDLQNPWRGPGYNFPKEKYIQRNIFDRLLDDLNQKEITVVVGSRQAGKTFLMKKMIERLITKESIDPRQIFYFNFDAFNLIDLINNDRDFLDFIKYYGSPEKTSYIFLDEAQRVSEIGLLLKRYYDLGGNLKFIVSGSSSLQIKGQVKETLTGRKHLFELYPITFREFLQYKGIETHEELTRIIRFESERYQYLMEEFVLFGGYPGVVKLDGADNKIRLLKEIYQSYVQKDISDFLKIEDIGGFNRMVQFLAHQTGGLCKINEMAKNIRLSRHFVEKYLFALDETYVMSFIRPYFVNLGKAIIKTPKVYFCDTGIRNAVFGQFESLDKRPDTGALVENFVFSELVKSIDRDYLWFYRTVTGSEIDFLFVNGDDIIPIEVKYAITRQKIVPKVYNTFIKHVGIKKAVIVTKDYLHEERRGNLKVLFRPAWSVYNLNMEFEKIP